MEIKVKSRFVRTTPRKLRLVAAVLKNQPAVDAKAKLKLLNKHAAKPIILALSSALAIAKERDLDAEKFVVVGIRCDQGPRLKRRIMKSRGQASQIQKRMSHLSLIISDDLKLNSDKASQRVSRSASQSKGRQKADKKISKEE